MGIVAYEEGQCEEGTLIARSGQCQAYLLYGREGVLVQAIKVEEATGLLVTRYAPERYREFGLE